MAASQAWPAKGGRRLGYPAHHLTNPDASRRKGHSRDSGWHPSLSPPSRAYQKGCSCTTLRDRVCWSTRTRAHGRRACPTRTWSTALAGIERRLHEQRCRGACCLTHLRAPGAAQPRSDAEQRQPVARLAREARPATGLLTRLCTATRYLRPQLGTCCGDASLVQHDGEPLAAPMPADVADDLSDHLALESGKKQIPQPSVLCQHVSGYPRD